MLFVQAQDSESMSEGSPKIGSKRNGEIAIATVELQKVPLAAGRHTHRPLQHVLADCPIGL